MLSDITNTQHYRGLKLFTYAALSPFKSLYFQVRIAGDMNKNVTF